VGDGRALSLAMIKGALLGAFVWGVIGMVRGHLKEGGPAEAGGRSISARTWVGWC